MVSFLRHGFGRWLAVLGLAASAVAATVPSSGAQAMLQPATADLSSLAHGTRQLTDFVGTGAWASPYGVAVLGTRSIFYADDGIHGNELWVTDGTTEGTKLLKDIAPGASSSAPEFFQNALQVMGDRAYFSASSGELDQALWSTDGTTAGTQLVHQFTVDYDDCAPHSFAVLNSRLYFAADDVDSGCELWISDGTDAGTRLVKDVVPGGEGVEPENLTTVGSKIVYSAFDGNGDKELWVTDGTSEGTRLLKDMTIGQSSYPTSFVSFGSGAKVAFKVDTFPATIWVTDGTSAGTVQDSPVGAFPNQLISAGSAIYYSGTNSCTADPTDACSFLYSSGGIVILESPLNEEITDLVFSNNTVFFIQEISLESKLFALNGAVRTAVLSARPDLFDSPSNLMTENGKLYFSASSADGFEVWTSNGTDAGTHQVKDFELGDGNSRFFGIATVGSKTLLAVANNQYGFELWLSDGSASGTTLLKDINTGSTGAYFSNIVTIGNRAFYSGSGDLSDQELWSTDVTTGVSTLVKDINQTGSGDPYSLTVLGNKIVFAAVDDLSGYELWISDGTQAGTTMLKDINPGSAGSYPDQFVSMGDKLYFVASGVGGYALWVTDGTQNGTQAVGGTFDGVTAVVATTNKVFLLANDGLSGYELWVTNGTDAPTLIDISAGPESSLPSELLAANDYVVFGANSGTSGVEIWKSDGTLAGTFMVKDINTISNGIGVTEGSTPFGFTKMGSRVLFAAADDFGNFEPWITDGTEAGTRKIKEINSDWGSMSQFYGTDNSFAVAASNTRAYFSAADRVHGEELWVTDGTEAGTHLVKDISNEYDPSFPQQMVIIGEKVFFAAQDFNTSSQYSLQSGYELWTSDGTEEGTYLVRNMAPDSASSNPSNLHAIGDRLLFAADAYNGHGKQLFITDGSRSSFMPLAQPVRILDTRTAGDSGKVGALDGSGAAYTLQVNGVAGVPFHGVAAVSLNVTAVATEAGNEGGYVTVYPCGTKPDASNLNFVANQIIPNAVVAPVSADGKVCFYVYGKAHLLADVSGWLPTGGFTALAQPERLLNTRPDGEVGKVGALDGTGTSYTLQVTGVKGIPASGVSAVAMNVTAVATEAGNEGGYVTVYPCGTPPDASNLNFTSNQIIPNGVIAPVSADGKVCFYVYGKAHLLADVSGWLPTGGFTALAQPYRLLNTRTAGDAGKIGEIDGSGVAYTLQVAGQGGLPSAGIGSVALNVTVVDGLVNEYGGYVTVYPCGTRPDASNLNFTTGQIVPNAVIAPVSADGKVCIYVYGKSHILVDASGYLAS